MRLRRWPSDAERASRYWSALVQGAPQAEAARLAKQLDPGMLDSIERVRALRTRHRPRAAFADRLERDLIAAFGEVAQTRTSDAALPPGRSDDVTSVPRRVSASFGRPAPRRWRLNELATVALLLLTVFGVYVSFVPTRLGPGGSETNVPASRESTISPTSDGLTTATLIEITVPAGIIQNGDRHTWAFAHYNVPPGERVVDPRKQAYCAPFDLSVTYVDRGTLKVAATNSFEVIRARIGESPPVRENISPSVETLLNAGDAAALTSAGASIELTLVNPTDQPVLITQLYWFNMCDDAGLFSYTPDLPESYGNQEPFDPASLLTIRLSRLTVQPGVVVPQDGPLGPGLLPADAAAWQIVQVDSGVADQVYLHDADPSSPSSTVTFRASAKLLPPPALPEGMTAEVRNASHEPLVLTLVTIYPASPP